MEEGPTRKPIQKESFAASSMEEDAKSEEEPEFSQMESGSKLLEMEESSPNDPKDDSEQSVP